MPFKNSLAIFNFNFDTPPVIMHDAKLGPMIISQEACSSGVCKIHFSVVCVCIFICLMGAKFVLNWDIIVYQI